MAQVHTYDSIYQPKPGITGMAKFTYIQRNNETIKNGDFQFIHEAKDSVIENIAVHQSWNGEYKNNLKVKDWEYINKTHKVKINEISQEELDYDIISHDEFLNITYDNGIPDQEVSLRSELFINNQKVKTLEELESFFVKGLISGTFEYALSNEEEKLLSINGKAQNGLMHGDWVFLYHQENLREERTYHQGILLELKKFRAGELETELEFPLSPQLEEVVKGEASSADLANKPLSLSFSDGYPRNSIYIKEQQKGAETLKTILERIFRYDETYDINQQLPLGTNRGYYPLDSEETKDHERWTQLQARYRNKVQAIKDMEIDNLNFVKDSTLQIIIAWTNKQQEIQEYIKPWNNIFSKEQISYYNREGLLNEYSRELLSRDSIVANDTVVIFEYNDGEGDKFLKYIAENMEERIAVADSLQEKFENKIKELSLNDQVMELNDRISLKKQKLDSLYTILPQNEAVARILRSTRRNYLQGQYVQELDEFLSEGSASKQLNLGEEIMANLQIMEEIHKTAMEFAESTEKLDELYTVYTFDPFTYSDEVPSRAKKRLYEIVAEEMMNFILNKRMEETAYKPAEVLKELKLARRLQERLAFMRDKNTDKLTRQLRRNKSFDKRLELINNF